MRKIVAGLMLCVMAGTASGQDTVTVGTNPGAPTTWSYLPETSGGISQTFIAAGDSLSKVSFWFSPAYAPPTRTSGWFAVLWLYRGNTTSGPRAATYHIDPQSQGRIDVLFDDPIYLGMGSVNTLVFWSDGCPDRTGSCDIANGPNDKLPEIEMTTTSAYYSGSARRIESQTALPGDVRFEAVFIPEPSTVVPALAAFALLAYRRRYTWIGPSKRGSVSTTKNGHTLCSTAPSSMWQYTSLPT